MSARRVRLRPRRLGRWAIRICLAVGLVGLTTVPYTDADAQDPGSLPFSGTAAATGVSVTLTVPGFPATNTPIDGSGPTAQVALDSLGSSSGYASFPYPGELVISAPGLIAGVLAGGAGGLPPIELPKLPDYPLYAKSDAATNPEANVGAGPYALTAKSSLTTSEASGTAGVQTGFLGNAALVTSTAKATTADDEVVFTATSNMEALTIGPLTIGQVKSTATERLGSDGTVTPSSSLEIAALKIAGIPIALSNDGLILGGPVVPLPINSLLSSLLSGAKVTIEVFAEQRFDNRIVAPGLKISMPVSLPNVGTGEGSMVITIGAATASLTGVAPASPTPSTTTPVAASGGARSNTAAPIPTGSGSSFPPASRSTTSPAPASTGQPEAASPAEDIPLETELIGLFDIKSLYLMMVVGALAAWVIGQFIRFLGVRSPWTSSAG